MRYECGCGVNGVRLGERHCTGDGRMGPLPDVWIWLYATIAAYWLVGEPIGPLFPLRPPPQPTQTPCWHWWQTTVQIIACFSRFLLALNCSGPRKMVAMEIVITLHLTCCEWRFLSLRDSAKGTINAEPVFPPSMSTFPSPCLAQFSRPFFPRPLAHSALSVDQLPSPCECLL